MKEILITLRFTLYMSIIKSYYNLNYSQEGLYTYPSPISTSTNNQLVLEFFIFNIFNSYKLTKLIIKLN